MKDKDDCECTARLHLRLAEPGEDDDLSFGGFCTMTGFIMLIILFLFFAVQGLLTILSSDWRTFVIIFCAVAVSLLLSSLILGSKITLEKKK